MKITALPGCIFLFISICISSQAQTIVNYGNSNISKNEFLRAFLKNNSEQKTSEKAVRDYLDLFIRFKLKVRAAYDLKLDTLPNQKAELTEFSRQIAEGYLNDEASFKNLVDEAFMRSQKDIHLAHIFIASGSGNKGITDTLKAWKLASAAYNELQKGSDFAKTASIYSSDSSVRFNHGDIGYITAFTIPYTFENLAYSTPVGKFSPPYHSSAGYHIFKNLGERKASGKVKAAQILLAFPADATSAIKASIKLTADSIYSALLKGAQFNQLADKYSNANATFIANGDMPEFGVGTFDDAFESAVFALTKDNAISKPVLTSIGYHIIKRLAHFPVNIDPANDSAMSSLKERVRADSRMDISRTAMSHKIKQVTGLKKSAILEKNLWSYAESLQHEKKPSPNLGISEKTLLFSFPDKNIYVADWIQHLKSPENIVNTSHGEIFGKLLDQYEQILVRSYYLDHLDKYNADFAAQIKEFKEGNLLFEVMQRNIWDKASADSSGLKHYFDNNKGKYQWEPSVEGIIFKCTDSATAYSIRNSLTKNKDWRTIIRPFGAQVQADSGRFELSQLPFQLNRLPGAGTLTEPLKNINDNNISFLYIVKEHTERSARSFEEAKGFVMSDYQAFLEEEWIGILKKKYPVKLNETVLKSLWK